MAWHLGTWDKHSSIGMAKDGMEEPRLLTPSQNRVVALLQQREYISMYLYVTKAILILTVIHSQIYILN